MRNVYTVTVVSDTQTDMFKIYIDLIKCYNLSFYTLFYTIIICICTCTMY